ncbi:MAG: glycosyltransferase [Parcubacteria group bacterium]|nr:glycosyltransferase [Parcubacteria group bacterium]
MIHITLPAYNEEQVLEKNVRKLVSFLDTNLLSEEYKIIIADNTSIDKTSEIAKKLSLENPNIIYNFILKKGKGLAVLSSWNKYPADINIFMDVDLSTNLSALPFLIQGIEEGNDIVIGSRRHQGSVVEKSIKRKVISWGLSKILQVTFKTKIKDTACGFKVVNKKVLDEVLPKIKNQTWFFDTELLMLGEFDNYKIKEVPIIWIEVPEEGRKSAVNIFPAIFDYLREIYNLKRRLL